MSHVIEVVPYNPNWPQMFENEALLIKQALGDNCIAIHHIGSTSIPALSAKPIIDILPVVKDILDVDNATLAMQQLGYEAKGEYGIAFRRHFQKGGNLRTHNVHIYEEGNPEIDRHLKFRDWMRTHPKDAKDYEKLKIELAAKFPNDMQSYTCGKDAFIKSIDVKDGSNSWRMVQALTDQEWAAVRALRQQYLSSDPFAWTFDDKDHIHFVFYKNDKIIGYAHLQLLHKGKAALRMIVIDASYRNHGNGRQLLKLCERWLSLKDYHELFLHALEKNRKFFSKLKFKEMPFEDPDGLRSNFENIDMGKVLNQS